MEIHATKVHMWRLTNALHTVTDTVESTRASKTNNCHIISWTKIGLSRKWTQCTTNNPKAIECWKRCKRREWSTASKAADKSRTVLSPYTLTYRAQDVIISSKKYGVSSMKLTVCKLIRGDYSLLEERWVWLNPLRELIPHRRAQFPPFNSIPAFRVWAYSRSLMHILWHCACLGRHGLKYRWNKVHYVGMHFRFDLAYMRMQ